MDPNPYEAPQTPPPRRRAIIPRVLVFGACVLVWLFLGTLMVAQYYDEAADYVPHFAMTSGGLLFVTVNLVLSLIYLGRALWWLPSAE